MVRYAASKAWLARPAAVPILACRRRPTRRSFSDNKVLDLHTCTGGRGFGKHSIGAREADASEPRHALSTTMDVSHGACVGGDYEAAARHEPPAGDLSSPTERLPPARVPCDIPEPLPRRRHALSAPWSARPLASSACS